jgi:hypothetical protein
VLKDASVAGSDSGDGAGAEAAATVISIGASDRCDDGAPAAAATGAESAVAPGAASCCLGACQRLVVASTNAVSPAATAAAGHQRQLILCAPNT